MREFLKRTVRRAAGGAGAVALLLLGAQPATPRPAQDDPVLGVAAAVLRHARPGLPAGRVALDPGPVCEVRLAGWSCSPALEDAVQSLEIGLGSRAFSLVCPAGPQSCRLVGTDVLLQLARPALEGRSAEAVLDVWWRSAGRPAVRHRRTVYQLRSDGEEWVVVEEQAEIAPPQRVR